MRSSPPFIPVAPAVEHRSISIGGVLRTLLELVEKDTCGPAMIPSDGDCGEEILFDTEVDGSRYLLLRMPKVNRNRVQLSPREQEIVRMVAKGHPNKVIADVLNISSWTVCTHLRRIFAKLGVGSRAAMVAKLLELGVLSREHRAIGDAR
jgi:DNA-binding CsgD family transcriptional regulator